MRNLLAIVGSALAAMAFMGPAAAVAADPPPTLHDEGFFDPNPTVTGSCNATGTSTIEFSAAGVASGPFPGTFTETGTVTIGPQPPGAVVTLTANFTIDSPVGQVSGSKQFTTTSSGAGSCRDLEDFSAHFVNTQALSYTATIQNEAGVFTDQGTSGLQVANNTNGTITNPDVGSSFVEFFQSDRAAPEPCPEDDYGQPDCDEDDY